MAVIAVDSNAARSIAEIFIFSRSQFIRELAHCRIQYLGLDNIQITTENEKKTKMYTSECHS